jgi:hypothetical protein
MVRPLSIAARGDAGEYYPQRAAAVVAKWRQEDVLPMLRPAFNWSGTSARLFVIDSICQMTWSELPTVVRDSLQGFDARARRQMRYSLAKLARSSTGRASQELAQLVAAELENPVVDSSLGQRLTDALTLCYPDSREVPSLLIDVLERDTRYTSGYACRELAEIAHEHLDVQIDERKRIMTAIFRMLQTTENDDLKRECINGLAKFGQEARAALPVLRKLRQEGPRSLTAAAASAIDRIDPPRRRSYETPERPAAEDPFGDGR